MFLICFSLFHVSTFCLFIDFIINFVSFSRTYFSSHLQEVAEEPGHVATNPTVVITQFPGPELSESDGYPREVQHSATLSLPATEYPSSPERLTSPSRHKSSSDYTSASPKRHSESSYVPSNSPSTGDDEYDEVAAPIPTVCVQQKKYLVFEDNLDDLMKLLKCPSCNSPVDIKEKHTSGTFLRVKLYCISGHLMKNWTSQPLIDHTPAGNLLCAASTLFSGNTEKSMRQWAAFLGMEYISKSTFYENQMKFLVPVINDTYTAHQSGLLRERQGTDVEVVGDGRCDSPGFSAKYCTYSMMERTTHEILASELVQVSQATSSVGMEKVGFEQCMQVLHNASVKPSLIATDRHIGIRALIRTKYPEICHQFDVWHLAKSVKKKLLEASKKKASQDLAPWIQSISNHIWWCADSCGGSADLLVEMWTSLTYHITDQHEWQSGEHFHRCAHPPLEDEDRASKAWLQSGSPAHDALNEIIFAKPLLKDIRLLTRACHTGELEVFHGALLKYCPKRQEFDYLQMQARNQLAVLDHNCNITNRAHAVVKRERPGTSKKGTPRYKLHWSKSTKRWVLKKIYKDRKYDYIYPMLEKVIEMKLDLTEFAVPALPDLPRNVAPIPAPSKEELMEKLETRFRKE